MRLFAMQSNDTPGDGTKLWRKNTDHHAWCHCRKLGVWKSRRSHEMPESLAGATPAVNCSATRGLDFSRRGAAAPGVNLLATYGLQVAVFTRGFLLSIGGNRSLATLRAGRLRSSVEPTLALPALEPSKNPTTPAMTQRLHLKHPYVSVRP
jgi:hypothetical protein